MNVEDSRRNGAGSTFEHGQVRFVLPRGTTPQHVQITRFTPRKVASMGASCVISIRAAPRFHGRGPVAAACFPYMTTSTHYIHLWLTFPTTAKATACDSLPMRRGTGILLGIHIQRWTGLGTIPLCFVQLSVVLGARYAIQNGHSVRTDVPNKLRELASSHIYVTVIVNADDLDRTNERRS